MCLSVEDSPVHSISIEECQRQLGLQEEYLEIERVLTHISTAADVDSMSLVAIVLSGEVMKRTQVLFRESKRVGELPTLVSGSS